MTMKTKNPLPEKENKHPQFDRKTVTIGEVEPKKKGNILFFTILLLFSIMVMLIQKNVDWELAKEVPTIQDKPHFFKTLRSKQYFKSIVVPTAIPVPDEEIVEVKKEEEKKVEITGDGNKITIKSAVKQNISYSDLPNYNKFDSIIIRESGRYRRVKPVVIKAIIEQESHYNPLRQKYEEKWEREYGWMIPKKKNENPEEWQMNFRSYGLMQISYVLHKDFCELTSYMDLLDPNINIACGVKLYSACLEDGNSEAYCIGKHNGSGPAVEKYKREVLSRVARIMKVPTKLFS